MPGNMQYVPIIRWRPAEIVALQQLFEQDRRRITPLIEVLPTEGGGFAKITKDIGRNWGFQPFFLDLYHVNPALRLSDGQHPLVLMGKEAKALRIPLIPVTGLRRVLAYQAAVAAVAQMIKRGICIRLDSRDINRATFADDLLQLLSRHKLDPKQADLIVDFEITENSNLEYEQLCRRIPRLSRWRTFTVISGAFPKDLTRLGKNSQREPRRSDWLRWLEQIEKTKLLRIPNYGDHTVQHPNYSPPKGKPNPSASIRYTARETWVIMRGEALRGDSSLGSAQYRAQAMLLTERPEFCGAEFSYGDKYIMQKREDRKNPGNPRTWICAGINHHLTLAAREVASLS